MTKAVEAGMPKLRIEEAAARKQARIDRGEEVVVGVNKFQLKEEPAIEIRDVDNDMVRESQVSRLNKIRASRDEAKCVAALKALGDAARNGTGNLLTLSIEATRARATVGEISSRWKASMAATRPPSARSPASMPASGRASRSGAHPYRHRVVRRGGGRRPRLMVIKMGQDGHDRGAKVIATAFADLGFDVDIGPLFQTPEEAARAAIENDVHVIGVSSQAAGHKTLVPQLIEELAKQGGSEVLVVVGGVIPAQDYDFLKKAEWPPFTAPAPTSRPPPTRSCRSCANAATSARLSLSLGDRGPRPAHDHERAGGSRSGSMTRNVTLHSPVWRCLGGCRSRPPPGSAP